MSILVTGTRVKAEKPLPLTNFRFSNSSSQLFSQCFYYNLVLPITVARRV